MRSLTDQLKEFHRVYELTPSHSLVQVQLRCIDEEMEELLFEIEQGAEDEDLAKEAVDVVYTIVSMFVAAGWDFEAAFAEVHRSNMSKLGADGKPIHKDGKVQKGPNYSPANMAPIVRNNNEQ